MTSSVFDDVTLVFPVDDDDRCIEGRVLLADRGLSMVAGPISRRWWCCALRALLTSTREAEEPRGPLPLLPDAPTLVPELRRRSSEAADVVVAVVGLGQKTGEKQRLFRVQRSFKTD